MKKVRKALNNKNGFSYIPVCIFTLIVVMVIAILMQYAFICHVAREQRDEVQLLLDSYVTKEAIEYYDAFKQGKPYREYIDENELVDGAYSKIGFPRESTTEYTPSDRRYVMYRPSITPLSGDSVGVNVSYTLSIPFELWGRKIADITIPVEIVSKLTERNG